MLGKIFKSLHALFKNSIQNSGGKFIKSMILFSVLMGVNSYGNIKFLINYYNANDTDFRKKLLLRSEERRVGKEC